MGDLLSVKQLYDVKNGIPGRNITFSPNQKQIIEFGMDLYVLSRDQDQVKLREFGFKMSQVVIC